MVPVATTAAFLPVVCPSNCLSGCESPRTNLMLLPTATSVTDEIVTYLDPLYDIDEPAVRVDNWVYWAADKNSFLIFNLLLNLPAFPEP